MPLLTKYFRTLMPLGLCLLLAGIRFFNRSALANDDETDFKAIDGYITAKMQAARLPGVALAIVQGDQIVYLKGYGRADSSSPKGILLVTPQTPFLIGSITKPFTALAVMQLVEAGKVELDAPVQRYIPWFRLADPQASAQITVRQLLRQTSGIPQVPSLVTWTWPDDDNALERHVRLLANVEPSSPPGRSFAYSNPNFVILGMIVQAVSGQSYEDYVRQHIFAPLEMKHSFVSQAEAMQDGMAMGHQWWFGIPFPATVPYNRANLPAGFAICSAEDMAHFLLAEMNNGRYRDRSILSPEKMALLHTEPAPKTYGLGWESVRIDGRRLIYHDGGNANFQASVFFDPEARVGVFIAANVFSALDTFSSEHGASSLDGPTTRSMAESVLSLAMNQPLPKQGIGNLGLYAIYDLLLLGLTGALIRALARIPGRYQRLAQRGIANRSDLAQQTGRAAILHFAGPAALLAFALKVPNWILFALFLPDLVYWLETVAVVLSLKGVLEIALLWRVFRRTPTPAPTTDLGQPSPVV